MVKMASESQRDRDRCKAVAAGKWFGKHHGKVVCDGEGRRNNPAKPFGLTLQKIALFLVKQFNSN